MDKFKNTESAPALRHASTWETQASIFRQKAVRPSRGQNLELARHVQEEAPLHNARRLVSTGKIGRIHVLLSTYVSYPFSLLLLLYIDISPFPGHRLQKLRMCTSCVRKRMLDALGPMKINGTRFGMSAEILRLTNRSIETLRGEEFTAKKYRKIWLDSDQVYH